MTAERPDPLWPSFWADVPSEERAPLRDILAELLGRGVLLGDTGSGRELFLLARDHHRFRLEDYLAPLGLEFLVDDEAMILQARPRTESCQLLGSFSKDETLILLTLWRVWDEAQTSGAHAAVLLRLDDLWEKLRVYFDRIEPPEKSQIEAALTRLKRHRLVRTQRPDQADHPGDILIEVLPTLARAIPFESIDQWQDRANLASPPVEPAAPISTP
jgi:Domain of unknown function (DUF4194)